MEELLLWEIGMNDLASPWYWHYISIRQNEITHFLIVLSFFFAVCIFRVLLKLWPTHRRTASLLACSTGCPFPSFSLYSLSFNSLISFFKNDAFSSVQMTHYSIAPLQLLLLQVHSVVTTLSNFSEVVHLYGFVLQLLSVDLFT